MREAIPKGEASTTSWRREAYGGFLLDLELDTLDDEAFLRVCRETGRVHDLADRLLSLGRIEEALQVARAVAETRPHAALEIYRQQVERLIDGRNRGSYGEAARLLAQMRGIYTKLGESEAWSSYIEELRERYRSLRALKEELAAAGI